MLNKQQWDGLCDDADLACAPSSCCVIRATPNASIQWPRKQMGVVAAALSIKQLMHRPNIGARKRRAGTAVDSCRQLENSRREMVVCQTKWP